MAKPAQGRLESPWIASIVKSKGKGKLNLGKKEKVKAAFLKGV
jgi:hypothetical protein